MTADLSIIIVSWNVADLLRECLGSIFSRTKARLQDHGGFYVGRYAAEICVVDNASSDGSPEMVRRQFPQVELIACDTNLGFAAANNLALKRRQGRCALLLNPDTRIVGDALAVMLDYMEEHPDVGVLGPQLRYGDGSLQPSRRRFPTLMTALMESTLLHQWFPRNRWAQRYHLADTPDDRVQDVDWITGACMLVRGKALERVGLFDQEFFMYSEELDLCRRMVDDGWRVVYLPDAVITHYEGQSSEQVVALRHTHFETSKILYFRKHHGAIQAEVLRLFLLLTYLFRLTEEGLKCLVGHRRTLRRERIRAYAQVLRSGLRSPRKPGKAHANG